MLKIFSFILILSLCIAIPSLAEEKEYTYGVNEGELYEWQLTKFRYPNGTIPREGYPASIPGWVLVYSNINPQEGDIISFNITDINFSKSHSRAVKGDLKWENVTYINTTPIWFSFVNLEWFSDIEESIQNSTYPAKHVTDNKTATHNTTGGDVIQWYENWNEVIIVTLNYFQGRYNYTQKSILWSKRGNSLEEGPIITSTDWYLSFEVDENLGVCIQGVGEFPKIVGIVISGRFKHYFNLIPSISRCDALVTIDIGK
ncbi:MAG: hypothetical protein ACXAC7_17820, partial [Candidatus Hodarchaeales archaeon]